MYYIAGVSPHNNDHRSLTIDEISFEYDCSSNIYGFRDGEFDFLYNLRKEGLLSRESAAEIAKIHLKYGNEWSS